MTITPIADGIPTERAWKDGLRTYVRCGYNSQLNSELIAIRATWDPAARARWVGPTKAAQVLALVEAAERRKGQVVAVKAAASAHGWWVTIPFDAEAIRTRAKALHGVFDGIGKMWAMPTVEAHAEIVALVATYTAQVEQARAARHAKEAAGRAAQAEREKAAAAETAATRSARVIARSGRTPTGETGQFGEHSTARMNRAGADAQAREIGSIVRVSGRRAVITGFKTWFTGEEAASSTCWHADTHDEAHWDWRYDVSYVEATAEEIAADEAELAAAFAAVEDDAETTTTDTLSTPTGPTIARSTGGVYGSRGDGRIVLDDATGRVVYQHPGYYDDYRSVERWTTSPAVVARVRALLDRGTRTVGRYIVTSTT